MISRLKANPEHHRNNLQDVLDSSDPLFNICWSRQSCSSCLRGDVACSWCAISSTCVPNPAHLPILAPLYSTHICPLDAKERWELRALPFGCSVSTTTFLSTTVAALSTFALIGMIYLVIAIVKWARNRWKEAEHEQLDDQEREFSWWGCLDPRLVVCLWTGLFGEGQGQQGQSQRILGDEQDDTESRPLLE
ncbi:uncharacterized protein N7477_002834 [Penicillium maclennaniae]|uniref:uncharacterized protein n=1 Tax=Penicillium maclennaniae TaxID=1343394 RepID=UPI002540DB39|nr:uncharacterized protein N7477_002834 [Penicillium maclennaniae]KAJ5677201.1 hypothetical protein N7477_002834 [Penicillium maclennaniae]